MRSQRAAEIQVILEGVRLPATREEMVAYARRWDADAGTQLAQVPKRSYESIGRGRRGAAAHGAGSVSVVDAVRPGVGAERSGHLRIYADPAGAAELMRQLVGLRLFDALLGEEEGHWYVDVRDGDGVLSRLFDLVSSASGLGQVDYAILCAGERTLTFP